MKKIQSILISSSLIIFCLTTNACVSVSSTGSEENRNVDNFQEINLALAAEVHLIQGNEYKVRIEASDNDLQKIVTEVSGNKLEIKNKDWTNNIGKVTIYVTMPEVEGLSVTGSGSIISNSSIETEMIDLSVSGSGSIVIDALSAADIDATITGSGDIKLSGTKTAKSLDLNITGSGNFNGENNSTETVDVTITGSGSSKVYAINELRTNITGSGSVYYKGNPQVNANTTGSGKTRSM